MDERFDKSSSSLLDFENMMHKKGKRYYNQSVEHWGFLCARHRSANLLPIFKTKKNSGSFVQASKQAKHGQVERKETNLL